MFRVAARYLAFTPVRISCVEFLDPVDRLRLFAELIRDRRVELGDTQAEAARRAGISVSTWRHLERLAGRDVDPRSMPKPDTVRRIARALDLSVLETFELAGTAPTAHDLLEEVDAEAVRLGVLADAQARSLERLRQVVARGRALEDAGDRGSDACP